MWKINNKAQCLVDDGKGNIVCSKNYPKEFRLETSMGNDSYALYKRPNNGLSFENKFGDEVDNRWIVPYNPYLSVQYNAHINVEICASVKSVKYLYKYVYKGHDIVMIVIQKDGQETKKYDEVQKFVDMRYITPHEAFWRIMEYDLDGKSHSVTRLDLHLPGLQNIYYKTDDNLEEVLAKYDDKDSTLMAYFNLNKNDLEARKYYYYEIPEHYTYKKVDNEWKWEKKEV